MNRPRLCAKLRGAYFIILLVSEWPRPCVSLAFPLRASAPCHRTKPSRHEEKGLEDLNGSGLVSHKTIVSSSREYSQTTSSPDLYRHVSSKETQSTSIFLSLSRREMARDLASAISFLTVLGCVDGSIGVAHAARGAAELDLEFYLRDLVGGNPMEGTTPTVSTTPLVVSDTSPPVDEDFCAWFETTALSLLVDQVRKEKGPNESGKEIYAKYDSYQGNPAIQRAFAAGTASSSPTTDDGQPLGSSSDPRVDVGDNHQRQNRNFDLKSYAIWRTATDVLPTNYRARDEFLRTLGRAIVRQAQAQKVFSSRLCKAESLMEKNEATIALLEWFKTTLHLCTDYRIASDSSAVSGVSGSDSQSQKAKKKGVFRGSISEPDVRTDKLFDELDDEALNVLGVSVNPLVTIEQSATLGASLQLNGEGSRFAPDWLGPSLAALWEDKDMLVCTSNDNSKEIERQVSWESFFVDPVYRPNPKDYFPTEQLYQFTIVNK